jgi:hypothetical protein
LHQPGSISEILTGKYFEGSKIMKTRYWVLFALWLSIKYLIFIFKS